MTTGRLDLQPARVLIRHIRLRVGGAPRVNEHTVLGLPLVAQDERGINGEDGWVRAGYVRRRDDDGEWRLALPNAAGGDGVQHLRRFATTDPDIDYEIGDEWLEIYELRDGVRRLLMVGTPSAQWSANRSTIQLAGSDAGIVLADQRELGQGNWCNAPRDVFEHYTGVWTSVCASDFTDLTLPADSSSDQQAGPFTIRDGHITAGRVLLTSPADTPSHPHAMLAQTAPRTLGQRSHWRLEVNLTVTPPASTGVSWTVRLDTILDESSTRMGVFAVTGQGGASSYNAVLNRGVTSEFVLSRRPVSELTALNLVLESRGRWLYGLLNGQLIGIVDQTRADAVAVNHALKASSSSTDGTQPVVVSVENWLYREHQAFLSDADDPGDYRLAGVVGSGSLLAEYYDNQDVAGPQLEQGLAPNRSLLDRGEITDLAQLVDDQHGPGQTATFSARATGAIWLPLSQGPVQLTFRLQSSPTAIPFDACRCWIGKTRMGEQLLDAWEHDDPQGDRTFTVPALDGEDGWYPIIVEIAHRAATALFGGTRRGVGTLLIQPGRAYTDPGGHQVPATTKSPLPASSMSPYGILQAQVRNDSHAEQLRVIAAAFALQWTTDPRQLESGRFPGVITPRVRVGADTDVIVDCDQGGNATGAQVQGQPAGTLDTLRVDAQGLADPDGTAQTSYEAVDYQALQGSHLLTHTGYVSIPDLARVGDVQQRATSMLELQATQWQEVSADPDGRRELVHPLDQDNQGGLQIIDGEWIAHLWLPGYGVRIRATHLGVDDPVPRQMISASWDVTPDGIGRPQIAFRQRPRSNKQALRYLHRVALGQRRNYQGQLAIVPASIGGAGGVDGYTRAAAPAGPAAIAGALLQVTFLETPASGWTIEVTAGGVVTATGIPVLQPGAYDLRGFLRATATARSFAARLTGGTGGYQIALQLTTTV